MAQVRVELRGALSHTRGQRTFTKGKPQIITDMGEIAYYRAQTHFAVIDLEEAPSAPSEQKPKSAASAGAAGGKTKAKAGDEEPPL